MAQIKWAGGSGDWATKADWVGGAEPTATDDAVIAAAGTYTVTIDSADAAHSLTVNDSGATVAINSGGTLTLGSTLTLTAGTIDLNSGGVISGGTISDAGSGLVGDGGTLDGVTYEGTLNLTLADEGLFVTSKGLILEGAGGTGKGTVDLTGYNNSLDLEGSQTLNNATIDIGNSGYYSSIEEDDTLGAGGQVLTLGSGLTIDQTGTYAAITGSTTAGDGVVNKATINASLNGGQFHINPLAFTNDGKIAVSGGDTVTVYNGTTLDNSGGSITVDSASTLVLLNALTTAQLGSVSNAGTLILYGHLTNTGATLSVGGASALGNVTLASGGVISGGTISDAGSGLVGDGGTLDGVTYEGTLNLTLADEGLFVTSKGLILEGAGGTGKGTVDLTGYNNSLDLEGSQTLNNATIDIGNSGYYSSIEEDDTLGAGGQVLTLGSGLTIDQTGTYAAITGSTTAGDGVVNKATINASLNGGQFHINPLAFTNDGKIAVSGGDTVTVYNGTTLDNSGGSITVDSASTLVLLNALTTAQLGSVSNAGTLILYGHLTNTGATLSVGGASALGNVTLASGGVISGGTISDAGSGLVGDGGTLDGVTYEGTLNLTLADEGLFVTSKGLILEGAGGTGKGTVDLTGYNNSLDLEGSQTLNNATIDIGNSGYYSSIEEDDTLGAGGQVLTLGSGLTIDQTGTYAAITGSTTAGDGVVNKATINASLNGGQFHINPLAFTNDGKIAVSGGDTVTVYNGTTLDNSGGSITVDSASTLVLLNALTTAQLGSVSNAGTLILYGHLTNTGATLSVGGASALGNVTLASGGVISGGTISDAGSGLVGDGGTLDGVTYEGTLNLTLADEGLFVTSKGLILEGAGGTGKGTVDLTGYNNSLDLEGSQTLNNATIDIGNSGYYSSIEEDDTLGAGGQVLTLGSGLTIDQTGTYAAITGSTTAGDGVVNKATINASLNGGQFHINPLAFTNDGKIAVSGGDTVTVYNGTTLDNSGGSITVDSASTLVLLNALTTAQLGSVSNAGTLILYGHLTNTGATLSVGGASALGNVTLASGGVISGGTISDAGSGLVGDGGTLDGVTYEGTLNLTLADEGLFVTSKGLILEGAGGTGKGTVDLTGYNNSLDLEGSQTLNNATIDIGNSGYYSSIEEDDTLGAGGQVLTLGSGLTIDQTGTYAAITGSTTAGDGVVNKATINASLNGGQFHINPLAFTNDGKIAVSGGDTVTFDTSVNDATGTLSVGASSTVNFGNAASLAIQGTLSNAGTINLQSGGSATNLHILTNGLTLTGGGSIDLAGPYARIYGASASVTLANVDNTIAGAGFIGLGELTLVNEAVGVIDADAGGGMIINTAGRTLTNAGLIEASNGVVLVIAGTTVNNAGGVIEALKGRVDLQTADIIGGALTATSSGIFETNTSGGVLNGVTQAVTLSGRLGIINGTNLTIEGAVVNQGTIILGGAGKVTDLAIGAGGATLSGSGLIEMSDVTFNHIDSAAAATLANLNDRIFGAGTIGNANLTLVNDAAGVIASNSGTALTLDTGANTIMNAGDIEGGNGTGGVIVQSAVDNTGRLIALKGNLTVNGAVTGAGTATINAEIMSFGSAFSEDVTFSAATGELVLAQSQSYAATISGFSKTGGTSLVLKDIGFVKASEATFSGGVLTVTDGAHTAHIHLSGNYIGVTFTASADGAGVMVVASSTAPAARTNFISAMASFAASPSAASAPARSASANLIPLLAPPAAHIAA